MFTNAQKFIFVIALFASVANGAMLIEDGRMGMLALLRSLVFPVTITPNDLHERYGKNALRILIVPGHDNKNFGAEFRGIRESDLNLYLARELYALLELDGRFRVMSARNFETGEYIDELARYFVAETESIKKFRDESQAVMDALIAADIAVDKSTRNHSFASDDVALQLYGINKWANEHAIDITLHIHFNDHPRSARRYPGVYEGFAVYVPEEQYPNSEASVELGQSIFKELAEHFPISNQPFEKEGIVKDHDLIAVGANASREGASLLVEYGYIYEPHIVRRPARDAMMREFAYLTHRGIKGYFEKGFLERENQYDTALLPYTFEHVLEKGTYGTVDVLALQKALRKEGIYPPPGKDLKDCPMNGNFGVCVEQAVKLFQEQYQDDILRPFGINYGTGIVGRGTLKKLNELYGG